MKPSDEMPIEPLSEATWNRIEKAVFDELDDRIPAARPARERTLRWPLIALGAVVAIQAAVALLFLFAKSDSRDSGRAGLDSARFVTGKEPNETLLGDVAIGLEPESALVVVKNAAAGSLVVLERGAARFSVPPREQRPAFVVQAGEVRVEVVGTRFLVERIGGSARVEAYEGKVRVVARGQSNLLQRGERWPESAPTNTATEMKPQAADRYALGVGQAHIVDRAAQEHVVDGAAQPPVVGRAAQPHVVDRAAQPQVVAPDRGERFERAALLEASDPRQALRIYRRLAAEGGRWGENALYAMGRLEMERGQRANAARLLRTYLDRHPHGANASDARALVERLAHEPEQTAPK
jgi:hypothetical protein